jgi:hypothetical protein
MPLLSYNRAVVADSDLETKKAGPEEPAMTS